MKGIFLALVWGVEELVGLALEIIAGIEEGDDA